MAADIECGIFIGEHRSVGEGLRQCGIAPDNDEQAAELRMLRNHVDILARRCREQSRQIKALLDGGATVSAEAAVAAIMARADEDGAMHRDAMIDVLRKMGAK